MNKREHEEICRLASSRYPRDPPDLAVLFYLSDRRAAGLGALDERKRTGRAVSNHKSVNMLTGDVHYSRVINRPSADYYDVPPLPYDLSDMSETVTVVRVPAKRIERCLNVSRRVMETQRGRHEVAMNLREMRRQTREES